MTHVADGSPGPEPTSRKDDTVPLRLLVAAGPALRERIETAAAGIPSERRPTLAPFSPEEGHAPEEADAVVLAAEGSASRVAAAVRAVRRAAPGLPIVVVVAQERRGDAGRGALVVGAHESLCAADLCAETLERSLRDAAARSALQRRLGAEPAYVADLRGREARERFVQLGRLAAVLGHEIGNPLSYVVSNLSYLRERLGDLTGVGEPPAAEASEALAVGIDDARSAASDALEGAERVTAIVRDVRALARGERSEAAEVSVRDALESALRIVRGRLVGVAEVTLALGEVPLVRASDTALLQVFVNLLANAADACAELPEERHEVTLRSFTGAGGRAVVEIRDTGPGVPRAARRRLFEPFFTTKPSGSGLGLSISAAIVESFGGSLVLEAAAPRGTRARVELAPARAPLQRPGAAAPRRRRVAPAARDALRGALPSTPKPP